MSALRLVAPSLNDLQQDFALGLQRQSNSIETCICDYQDIDAGERLSIYQNNFTLSLIEILLATYPAIEKLLGEECFNAIAKFHVLNNPLTQSDVSVYGDGFDRSLKNFKDVIQACPYVTELARLEWTIDLSRQAFDNVKQQSNCLPLDHLGEVNEQQHTRIQFQLAPAVLLLKSEHSVFSLRNALLESDCELQQQLLDQLNLNKAEFGFIVTFNSNQNQVSTINSTEYELLQAFSLCKPLQEIDPTLLPQLQSVLSHKLVTGFTLKNIL